MVESSGPLFFLSVCCKIQSFCWFEMGLSDSDVFLVSIAWSLDKHKGDKPKVSGGSLGVFGG